MFSMRDKMDTGIHLASSFCFFIPRNYDFVESHVSLFSLKKTVTLEWTSKMKMKHHRKQTKSLKIRKCVCYIFFKLLPSVQLDLLYSSLFFVISGQHLLYSKGKRVWKEGQRWLNDVNTETKIWWYMYTNLWLHIIYDWLIISLFHKKNV